MQNEKITDFFIGELLKKAKIDFMPNGSKIREIRVALKTASKKGTGKAGFPEFTAESQNFIIVIENKATVEHQAKYTDEESKILATDTQAITQYAENGALHYARQIIAKTAFKHVFAFGCSGNEKHHIIRPIYVSKTNYTVLESVDNFENFAPTNIEKYYREQILKETPPEMLELERVLKKSAELHEILRNYGQLGDAEKPLVVSAILLALCDDSFKTENLTADQVRTDGQKIFASIEDYMTRVEVTPDTKKEKVLNQFIILKDRTLLNQIDTRLAKTPLKYFTEFLEKHILASVKAHSKEDILGRFYGEFIRYSGGDGQTLGVVLTPSHITDLFCDLVDLKPTDKVFDPACGTGGFLITAMHSMLKGLTDPAAQTAIKKNRLHGIEIREDMFSIATTNMILRGDGKSNLENKDFLRQNPADLQNQNYTVGFMNPPYSQAKGKDTAHLSEIHFIEHLLDSLAEGGRCVVIIPQSTMVGKTKIDKQVKKRLLEKHTLEGVITLNKETFYGIGTNPCLAVFTAHQAHPKAKYCKFINYEDDGFSVRKHIGLVETERAKERKSHLLDCWLHDAPAETKFMVKTRLEPHDEWLHSFYYFNDEIPKAEAFEKTIADYLAFEFNMIMQGRSYLFENQDLTSDKDSKKNSEVVGSLDSRDWKEFLVVELFTIERGKRLTIRNRIKGNIPLVTAGFQNEGVVDLIGNKNQKPFSNAITIDMFGNVFYRIYPFKCDDNIHVLQCNLLNASSYKFICVSLRATTKDIFSYGKQFRLKTLQKLRILLPTTLKGKPDYAFMEAYMRERERQKLDQYQTYIQKRLDNLQVYSDKDSKKNSEVIEDLEGKHWEEFVLGEIFEIKSSSSGIDKNKLICTKGEIPYLTRSERNNGCESFVDIQSEIFSTNQPNVISIGLDTQTVFYQPHKFYTGQNIQVLGNDKLNRAIAQFMIPLIKRQMVKFNWGGNGATLTRLRRSKILLPATSTGVPDYAFMEAYMRQKERLKLEDYQNYIGKRSNSL